MKCCFHFFHHWSTQAVGHQHEPQLLGAKGFQEVEKLKVAALFHKAGGDVAKSCWLSACSPLCIAS